MHFCLGFPTFLMATITASLPLEMPAHLLQVAGWLLLPPGDDRFSHRCPLVLTFCRILCSSGSSPGFHCRSVAAGLRRSALGCGDSAPLFGASLTCLYEDRGVVAIFVLETGFQLLFCMPPSTVWRHRSLSLHRVYLIG